LGWSEDCAGWAGGAGGFGVKRPEPAKLVLPEPAPKSELVLVSAGGAGSLGFASDWGSAAKEDFLTGFGVWVGTASTVGCFFSGMSTLSWIADFFMTSAGMVFWISSAFLV